MLIQFSLSADCSESVTLKAAGCSAVVTCLNLSMQISSGKEPFDANAASVSRDGAVCVRAHVDCAASDSIQFNVQVLFTSKLLDIFQVHTSASKWNGSMRYFHIFTTGGMKR